MTNTSWRLRNKLSSNRTVIASMLFSLFCVCQFKVIQYFHDYLLFFVQEPPLKEYRSGRKRDYSSGGATTAAKSSSVTAATTPSFGRNSPHEPNSEIDTSYPGATQETFVEKRGARPPSAHAKSSMKKGNNPKNKKTARERYDSTVGYGSQFSLPSSLVGTVAVSMIAFANATKTRLVDRAVRSFRARGKWQGWVVLITDNPQDFERLQIEDDRFIVLSPRKEDWDLSEEDYPKKNIVMKYKRFKSLIADYLDLDDRLNAIETVVYFDVDFVVCNPFEPWLAEKLKEIEHVRHKTADSYVTMFHRARNVAHSGMILIDRESSKGCLRTWRHLFDKWSMTHNRDQKLLTMMLKAGEKQTGCHIVRIPRIPEMIFPVEEDFIKRTCHQFFHITNTYHASQTNFSIQQTFLEEVLELTQNERNSDRSLARAQETF